MIYCLLSINMKKIRMSVSIDPKILFLVDFLIKEGLFRNRSHAVEYALTEFFKKHLSEEKIEEAFDAYQASQQALIKELISADA